MQTPTLVTTFASFVAAADDFVMAQALPPTRWTAGNTLVNLLMRVRPDIYDLIGDPEGSDFNPKRDDSRIPAFYAFVQRKW